MTTTIARYVTAGGAYVDAHDAKHVAVPGPVEMYDGAKWPTTEVSSTAICSGCSTEYVVQDTLHPLATEGPSVMAWAVANTTRWARNHAKSCRARAH